MPFVDDELPISDLISPVLESSLDSAGNESVIGAQRMDLNVSRDFNDIFRYQPGISVPQSVGRFGNTSINIRGLEGNRVLMVVDGVRMPDAFQQGPTQLGRDILDVSLLKQVSIVRGPGALIYGEGALAGAIAFQTKDALDFLSIFGQDTYAGFKGGHFTADRSWAETAIFAKRIGRWEGLLAYTLRDGNDLESRGEFPTDYQEYKSDYILSKITFNHDAYHRTTGVFEWQDNEIFTDLKRTNTPAPGPATITAAPPPILNVPFPGFTIARRTSALANDGTDRKRYSLIHDFVDEDNAFVQTARMSVFYQDYSISDGRRQLFTDSLGGAFGRPNDLLINSERNFFDQSMLGGFAIFNHRYESEIATHDWLWGADFLVTNTVRLREGAVFRPSTGGVLNANFIGETTPSKILPDITTTRAGAYLQDQITFNNGWRVGGGVRVQYYNLDVDLDDLFDDTFGTPGNLNEWSATPVVSLTTPLGERLSSVAQYARGYRAPPIEDAGVGFKNPAFQYVILPNPNLGSETSDSYSLGLVWRGEAAAGYVNGYYNRYDGFIETVVLNSPPPPGFSQVFQQQNLQAQIYGCEFSGEILLSGETINGAWTGWSLFGNFAYSVGDNLTNNIPLDSIPPFSSIAGLRYIGPDGQYGFELIETMVANKTRVSGTVANQFLSPGYATTDLLAYYNLREGARLNIGLFNLFNQEYYPWLNLRGVTNTQVDRTRFAAAGTNFSINLVLQH